MDKIPQRMQDVLKTIGENAVLYHLFVLTSNYPSWNVYQNLTDKGCDLVLINSDNNNKIKIEVKTRQRLYSTSQKSRTSAQFTVSQNEFEACDYMVGFWFELNRYYIVPKENLNETSSNGTPIYKYTAFKNTVDNPFLNKWERIEDKMKALS